MSQRLDPDTFSSIRNLAGQIFEGSGRFCLETGSQTSQGSQVPHAGRRLAQSQSFGNLLIREVFEMPHHQDFRIVIRQSRNRGFDLPRHLLTGRSGCRSEHRIGQLLTEIDDRRVPLTGDHNRLLSIDAPFR